MTGISSTLEVAFEALNRENLGIRGLMPLSKFNDRAFFGLLSTVTMFCLCVVVYVYCLIKKYCLFGLSIRTSLRAYTRC